MGKFADSLGFAAKKVAETLPEVKIGNMVFRVPVSDFSDAFTFENAKARASEYTKTEGNTTKSGMNFLTVAALLVIGESLLDGEGNPVLSDDRDMRAFVSMVYNHPGVIEPLFEHSGFKARLNELIEMAKESNKLTEPPTNEEIQEAALGNSKPPSVTE